jgi:hypothetical protein
MMMRENTADMDLEGTMDVVKSEKSKVRVDSLSVKTEFIYEDQKYMIVNMNLHTSNSFYSVSALDLNSGTIVQFGSDIMVTLGDPEECYEVTLSTEEANILTDIVGNLSSKMGKGRAFIFGLYNKLYQTLGNQRKSICGITIDKCSLDNRPRPFVEDC